MTMQIHVPGLDQAYNVAILPTITSYINCRKILILLDVLNKYVSDLRQVGGFLRVLWFFHQ